MKRVCPAVCALRVPRSASRFSSDSGRIVGRSAFARRTSHAERNETNGEDRELACDDAQVVSRQDKYFLWIRLAFDQFDWLEVPQSKVVLE